MITVTTHYQCDFGPETEDVIGPGQPGALPTNWVPVTLTAGNKIFTYLACPLHQTLEVIATDLVALPPMPAPVVLKPGLSAAPSTDPVPTPVQTQ